MSLEMYEESFDAPGTISGLLIVPEKYTPRRIQLGANPIDQGLKTTPVPFSREAAVILQNEVTEALNLDYPEKYLFSERAKAIFGNECKRFLMAIVGYLLSYKPLQTWDELVAGIVDENYATRLKKMRTATLTRRFKAVPDQDDGLEPYVHPRYMEFSDIGCIFNYKYWIRWEEPDPEDWKYSQIPMKSISRELREEWKDALRTVLPDSVKKVHPEEILLSVSSSSCTVEGPFGTSKVFKEKADPKKNTFSKSPLKGRRSVVYKGPTETRDCLILSIQQSNTIKWIEKQCAEIASATRYSAYGKTPEEFDRLLKGFYKERHRYYNRDLTKEGLTKPRWMLIAMGEVFKEMYPGWEIWEYFTIYSGLTIYVDGEPKETFRGHGLGMANALTTIMQCATFAWTQMKVRDSDEVSGLDALFYNDDATIRAPDDENDVLLTYTDVESDYLEALGLIPKAAKTYSSPVMILCERYFPDYVGKKDSYAKYIRRLPFAATNILVAKAQVHLIDDPAYGDLEPLLLKLLMSFWGQEWSSEEFRLPWWAGGWLKPNYRGVDLTFVDEALTPSEALSKGIAVGPPVMKPKEFRKAKGTWNHPIFGIGKINPWEVDPRVHHIYDINQPMGKIGAKYHRSLDDKEMHRFLIDQLNERWARANSPQVPHNIYTAYRHCLSAFPTVDFIPPKECLVEVPLEKISVPLDGPVYPPTQPNKLLGALSFFSGNKYIKYVIPYPHLPWGQSRYSISQERLSKYKESVLALPGVSSLVPGPTTVSAWCALKEYHYSDDYSVLEAWYWLTGRDTYPRPLYRSTVGELMYERRVQIYYYCRKGFPELWHIWCTLTRDIPIYILSERFTDEEWDLILGAANDPLDEEQRPIEEKQEEEEPDYCDDFWTWRMDRSRPIKRGLEKIFLEMDQHIHSGNALESQIMSSANRQGNPAYARDLPPRDHPWDRILQKVCNVERVTLGGVDCYRALVTDVFGDDGSDEGGSDGPLGGLFD